MSKKLGPSITIMGHQVPTARAAAALERWFETYPRIPNFQARVQASIQRLERA